MPVEKRNNNHKKKTIGSFVTRRWIVSIFKKKKICYHDLCSRCSQSLLICRKKKNGSVHLLLLSLVARDRMRATTFLIISSLHTTLVTPVLLLMDRKWRAFPSVCTLFSVFLPFSSSVEWYQFTFLTLLPVERYQFTFLTLLNRILYRT